MSRCQNAKRFLFIFFRVDDCSDFERVRGAFFSFRFLKKCLEFGAAFTVQKEEVWKLRCDARECSAVRSTVVPSCSYMGNMPLPWL